MSITQQPVPEDSLLNTYRGGSCPERWVGQGDCFSVAVAQPVSLSDFVHAFYSSPVFRIERAILRVVAGAPSTDAESRGVADGSGSSFAIWRVGERTTTQLLMCDRFEKTRSWFQVVPMEGGGTLLRFGSAVAASRNRKTEALWVGRGFRWLMGFHVLYSRVPLGAALRRVTKK
jgi:hypothetical protein